MRVIERNTAPSVDNTSSTLLRRLADYNDFTARENFFEKYLPAVREYCCGLGIRPDDVDEVAQAVSLRLLRSMGKFKYDRTKGRFRDYLKRVTRNAWLDLVTRESPKVGTGGTQMQQILEATPADGIARVVERVHDRELLDLAIRQACDEFPETYWEVYRLRVCEKMRAKEVGQLLNMKAGTVHATKSRFEKRLREILLELDPDSIFADES